MSEQMIESKEQLLRYFFAACKPPQEWRIGVEFEKSGVDERTGRAVPYSGPGGVEQVLKRLARDFAWTPVYEGDHILGLQRGESSVSLEPGGQVELSSAPGETLHDVDREFTGHLREIKEAGAERGIAWLGLGIHPLSSWKEIEVIPKERYAIMTRYMPRKGSMGLAMMRQTAAVQVNLDYQDEQDAMDKYRLSMVLSPALMALYANSAVSEGQRNGFLSKRMFIWQNTDPDRCGIVEKLFHAEAGFMDYVEYVLTVPMYFLERDGKWIEVGGKRTFGQFLENGFDRFRPQWEDWELHLSTIFTDVRFEPFLEIRGMDCPPPALVMSVPALLKGLLYDTEAREAAWDLVKSWTFSDVQQLYGQVSREGPRARIAGHSLSEIIPELVRTGKEGLRRQGKDESLYLESLEELLERGSGSPASEILSLWEGTWNKDMSKLIEYARF